MPVPTLDLETRRKKESIGIPVRLEEDRRSRGRAGAHQAAPLRGLQKRWARGFMALKKLVAGDWKMHGLSSDLEEIRSIGDPERRPIPSRCRACASRQSWLSGPRAPYPASQSAARMFTMQRRGLIPEAASALMLVDAGAILTIVGH